MAQIALQPSTQQNKKTFPTQIVTMALAFIVTIVAAVALGFAVDTNNMSFVYDNMQGTTDMLVMNAASTLCNGADAEDAAVQALALNPVVQSMQNVSITVASPPPAGTLHAGNLSYVYVELTGEKSNFFNQLVHGAPVAISASATTTCG